ncbi:hypothetical protein [Nostoc sp.]
MFEAVLCVSFMVVHCSNCSGEAFHEFLRDGFRLPETTVGNARLVDV